MILESTRKVKYTYISIVIGRSRKQSRIKAKLMQAKEVDQFS